MSNIDQIIKDACERGREAWDAQSMEVLAALKRQSDSPNGSRSAEIGYLTGFITEMFISLMMRYGVSSVRLTVCAMLDNAERYVERILGALEKEGAKEE
jgi:hypothetical protein